jgi:orotate phosphoribosyltransferase
MQSALLLQYPEIAEDLGKRIANQFTVSVDTVVSPAVGGLIIGHEVARAKGCRAIFSEKDDKGKPVLRRGFQLSSKEKVLVVEDVITTGLSTNEVIGFVTTSGAELIGIGSVVNRSGGENTTLAKWGKPVVSLLNLKVESWAANECQLCKKGIPVIKPGSRKIITT